MSTHDKDSAQPVFDPTARPPMASRRRSSLQAKAARPSSLAVLSRVAEANVAAVAGSSKKRQRSVDAAASRPGGPACASGQPGSGDVAPEVADDEQPSGEGDAACSGRYTLEEVQALNKRALATKVKKTVDTKRTYTRKFEHFLTHDEDGNVLAQPRERNMTLLAGRHTAARSLEWGPQGCPGYVPESKGGRKAKSSLSISALDNWHGNLQNDYQLQLAVLAVLARVEQLEEEAGAEPGEPSLFAQEGAAVGASATTPARSADRCRSTAAGAGTSASAAGVQPRKLFPALHAAQSGQPDGAEPKHLAPPGVTVNLPGHPVPVPLASLQALGWLGGAPPPQQQQEPQQQQQQQQLQPSSVNRGGPVTEAQRQASMAAGFGAAAAGSGVVPSQPHLLAASAARKAAGAALRDAPGGSKLQLAKVAAAAAAAAAMQAVTAGADAKPEGSKGLPPFSSIRSMAHLWQLYSKGSNGQEAWEVREQGGKGWRKGERRRWQEVLTAAKEIKALSRLQNTSYDAAAAALDEQRGDATVPAYLKTILPGRVKAGTAAQSQQPEAAPLAALQAAAASAAAAAANSAAAAAAVQAALEAASMGAT